MRHSTIVLTMDAYGHLFPGQEADTVSRFPAMLKGDSTFDSSRGAFQTSLDVTLCTETNGPELGSVESKTPRIREEKAAKRSAACSFKRVRASGLEPETYGLKVRCSTN